MTKPFDIAGLCVESAPARSRNRTAMLVAPIEPGHSAEAIGVLFELWDSPPAWFAVPSLDLQPSLAHALVTGAGENLGKQLNSRAAPEALGALESERKVLYAGSGAMAVAVVAHAERFAIGWVGTTRAYLVRGGVVEQLTQEHTLQNDALKCVVSAEEAAKLPADVLTRVIRMREDGERTPVDVVTRDLQPGDWVVLVTKEVHRNIDFVELGDAIAAAESAHAAVALVLGRALNKSRGHALGVVVMRRA